MLMKVVMKVLCMGSEIGKRLLPPVGAVEIEEKETQTFINTGATMNVMEMSMLRKLQTCLVVRTTRV